MIADYSRVLFAKFSPADKEDERMGNTFFLSLVERFCVDCLVVVQIEFAPPLLLILIKRFTWNRAHES